MKKKIFGLAIMLIGFIGMATAQTCPTLPRGQNYGFNNPSLYSTSLAANRLSRLAYDYQFAIDEGFRNGDLTRHERFVLESDLDRLVRRMDRALYDGRLSSSEWSFIQFDIRNFERAINREWNDDQKRDS